MVEVGLEGGGSVSSALYSYGGERRMHFAPCVVIIVPKPPV